MPKKPGPRARRTPSPRKTKTATDATGSDLIARARRKKGGELQSSVAFDDGEGGTFALGEELGELWGMRLPKLRHAFRPPIAHAHDAWTSANGASYVASEGKFPLVHYGAGAFECVPIPDTISRIRYVSGCSGATPEGDRLACLAEPYVINEIPRCVFAGRTEGRWRTTHLPEGRALALCMGLDGTAYASIGTTWPPSPRTGQVLRWRDEGEVESLPFPPEEGLVPTGAVGLHATEDGGLLAFFGHGSEEWVRPWLRARDGRWSRVESPIRFHGWVGQIRCRTWRGKVYVPTVQGIFSWSGKGSLVLESPFHAISIWPLRDRLVARGWKGGVAAHVANEGKGWKPFHVPEPETVFGGQGKAVWLGAGNKVPVVKLRWKAAPPPVKEPLAEEPVSLASFLRRLESMTSPRATARSAIEELEGHVGVAMAPDLRAFFAFHESRALHASVGQLRIWTEPTWGLPDSRSVERLASSVYREAASAIAALTNTIYLGADRGGQVYFAEIDPKRSEVFVYGPGVGELKLLCDSFASFAELNEIDERWQACCEDEGVDEDDLEREEFVLASPRLRALREEIRLRRGRFHLTGFDHSDVSTDFDETIPRLGGTKLEAVSRSCTSRLFNGARWLVWLLSGSHVHVEPAGARDLDADMRDPELAPLAATKVYWLWHLFLFDRRTELGTFLEVCARDPSRLVRTTAELMSELSVPGPVRAPLEHFRELRSVVLDAAAGRVRPLPKERGLRVEEERREKRLRELVAPAPSDSPRIAAQKKAVAKALHEPQPWDALTFAYFEEEDVERMLAATEARLTLSHGDYYPWLQKGIALQMLKRYPEALAAFDRALFLERENAWASAWINKSFVCGALGDRSGALLHLREALRIHPEHKQVARESDELAPYRGEPEFRALLEG